MTIKQLIFRNLKKNLKNYYLYVFALVFSVGLYFAFVTLQFDPALDEVKGSIKGAASIRTASILLVVIVAVFLLYANNIFIKRRSKEIGLFQLIGMTKGKIFRILSTENFLLYYGSLLIGVLVGFSFSRLIIMILFKITDVEAVASLRFSVEALIQTIIVFSFIYLFIMITNNLFIKRQSILNLFRVVSSTEGRVKPISWFEMFYGALGIIFIAIGYYVSSKLFGGAFRSMNELFFAMSFILASVIFGTYLFYKGSVSFIANLIRKKKNGHLTINDVLSLSSIMFRMKSSALLLTIITTVSALAIGLLSLSYIAYYSAESTAESVVPAHFSFTTSDDAEQFAKMLGSNGIPFKENRIEVVQAAVNLTDLLEKNGSGLMIDPTAFPLSIISDESVDSIDVSNEEAIFSDYSDLLQKFMSFQSTGTIVISGQSAAIPLEFLGLEKQPILSAYFTGGGLPVVIVDDTIYQRIKQNLDEEIQKESSLYIGIELEDEANLVKANDLFNEMNFVGESDSRLEISSHQKKNMGLIMFIVGFLGLTFLITSGCILYFKQMDESEDEKPSYTILRKLGFTQTDLRKGIQAKQLFNFGIPLVVGLLHSYFAVQSGWFLFGSELWSPMFIVMGLYTCLYSIFGVLSVLYSKRVIKEAL